MGCRARHRRHAAAGPEILVALGVLSGGLDGDSGARGWQEQTPRLPACWVRCASRSVK